MIYNKRAGKGVTITLPAFNVLRETMIMNIDFNERDIDRLDAISRYRNMTSEECAVGLIQQAMREWEAQIRHQNSPARKLLPY
jgi:hypothetical protein